MKAAIARTTSSYLSKTLHYLRYRIQSYTNLQKQLFGKGFISESGMAMDSPYDDSSVAKLVSRNIDVMRKEIQSKCLLPQNTSSNRGLVNPFTGTAATKQQSHDLLAFRQIGLQSYDSYIRYRILHQPSSAAPLRKHPWHLRSTASPKCQ